MINFTPLARKHFIDRLHTQLRYKDYADSIQQQLEIGTVVDSHLRVGQIKIGVAAETVAVDGHHIGTHDGCEDGIAGKVASERHTGNFIIDRGNNLIKRASQMKDLEAEIKKLL